MFFWNSFFHAHWLVKLFEVSKMTNCAMAGLCAGLLLVRRIHDINVSSSTSVNLYMLCGFTLDPVPWSPLLHLLSFSLCHVYHDSCFLNWSILRETKGHTCLVIFDCLLLRSMFFPLCTWALNTLYSLFQHCFSHCWWLGSMWIPIPPWYFFQIMEVQPIFVSF